ncbi:MAG: DUF3991 and TOPRIM domain-containing protein [Ruminococcus sp.]|nr:DUF3991 and TOPRIM domain-containing protein [Ruminococcus sp.]
MSKYVHFTKEELYLAKHSSIKKYLESIGETVLKSGTEYMWAKHDSVKFRGHVFYRHANPEQKGDAIQFLIEFFDFSFQDAVITLLDGKYMATRKTTALEAAAVPGKYHPKTNKLVMPEPFENNRRLYGYLCTYRKIDNTVVNYFIKRNLLFEEREHHNIVYIGKDKKGVVRYIGLKGTSSDFPFKGEVYGSNKMFCFRHIGSSNVLYIFEAFVDLLSYITLYHLNMPWHTYNYLATAGLDWDVIKRFLKDYPHISQIIICYDNDSNSSDGVNHGQNFAYMVQDYLINDYDVRIDTPYLKDWNEILMKGNCEND